jgi:hypothetical protein
MCRVTLSWLFLIFAVAAFLVGTFHVLVLTSIIIVAFLARLRLALFAFLVRLLAVRHEVSSFIARPCIPNGQRRLPFR